MHNNMVLAVTVALSCLPFTAGAQPVTQPSSGSNAPRAETSSTEGQAARSPRHADALAALQDTRVTLARLTEESMSQDAREALARVSTDFRALYRAYTGEEPTPQKTASQAAGGRTQPAADWNQSYTALTASLDRISTGRTADQSGAVGTSGSSGATSGRSYELTAPVRQDFEVLRQQLRRFHDAAAGQTSATTGK